MHVDRPDAGVGELGNQLEIHSGGRIGEHVGVDPEPFAYEQPRDVVAPVGWHRVQAAGEIDVGPLAQDRREPVVEGRQRLGIR